MKKRTEGILVAGWAKEYRGKAKKAEVRSHGDIWDAAPGPNDRPNRATRRASIKLLDRSLRIGLFGFGGKHRRKHVRSRVEHS